MLSLIRVKNYAVIDEIEVEFGGGFNVMTGETGAGKSILVDALGLALGDRADATAVRQDAERAEISVSFDVPNGHAALALARRARARRRDGVHAAAAPRLGRPLARIHQRPTRQSAGLEGARRPARRHSRPARASIAARHRQSTGVARRPRRDRAARHDRRGAFRDVANARRATREPPLVERAAARRDRAAAFSGGRARNASARRRRARAAARRTRAAREHGPA